MAYYDNLSQQYSAFTDPFGREEEDAVGNARPVTQTIKTDPITGEQTMTIKGSPYDLSAANPLTPTVNMPTGRTNSLAGPQDRITPYQPAAVRNAPMLFDDTSGAQGTGYMNQQTPAGDQVTPLGQGAPVPPMITPQAPMDNMNGNTTQAMAQPVQPAPGYDPESIAQVLQQAGLNYAPPKPIATMAQAGTSDQNPPAVTVPPAEFGGQGLRMPAAPAATPVAPVTEAGFGPQTTNVMQPGAVERPVEPNGFGAQTSNVANPAAVAAAATPPPPPPPPPDNPVVRAFNNTDPKAKQTQLEELITNKDVSEGERNMARSLLRDQLNEENKKLKAEKQISEAGPNDLAKYMRDRNTEGSYIKAILFGRLGLTELAKQEQRKLGRDRVMGAETDTQGNHYTVIRDDAGGIVKAFDINGTEANEKTISSLSAQSVKMKGATTAATLGKDNAGNVWSHTVIPGTSRMIWQNQTTGEISSKAPPGYHSMGQKEADVLLREKAIGTAAQLEASMRRQNQGAIDRGMTPPHTEADINRERQIILSNAGVGATSTSGSGLASSGDRSAAEINNPTGLGWNGKTWNPYNTPKEGVDASVTAVRGYLGSEGVMKNVKPTPENVVGMWVEGKPAMGPEVQGGRYVSSVRRELSAAGVELNSDGTIPNTPEAARAIVRAQIQHETAPANQGKFLEYIGGPIAGTPATATTPATTPASTPASTPAPANAASAANKTMAQRIANYEAPPLTGAGDKGRNLAIMAEVSRLNPEYDGQKYKENTVIIKDFTPGGTAGKSVVAMGTAANHIADLRPLVTALNNGDYQAANKLFNNIKQWTGNPDVTNIAAVGPAVAAEITKTFTSTGGSVGEREELAKAFGRANSPAQLNGAIDQYEKLMIGKLAELEKQYSRTGRKDFWQNVVSDPYLKQAHDRHLAEKSARSGAPLSGSTTSGVKWKAVTE
jgi:hypothetical protein